MKIYAIRDRLISYFMQPFIGPDDKHVLASVARLVNQGEVTSDIAQAPHQFEVWRLGQVQEDGTVTADREYLADCSSLIRTSVRGPGAREGAETQGTAKPRMDAPPGAPGGPNANPGALPDPAPATPPKPAEAHPAA